MSKSAAGYLGSYRLLNVVNTGHHCQVWQAYHDGRQLFVAVKSLLEKFRADKEHIGYLKREHAIGSKLTHERLIHVFEFGIDGDLAFLALEWFPSVNMKNRIRRGVELIANYVPKIVAEAAEGLAAFNARGWVHRDIKPENFLVNDAGDVKLIDYSLAKRRPNVLTRVFHGRAKIQGTRSYMSPEQIRGEALDQRADIYSFACTLFELVGGRPPFTGATTNELFNKHLKSPPPPLELLNDDVHPEFSQLVRWGLAKDRDKRPATSEEYCQRLSKVPVFRRPPQFARRAVEPAE